MISMERDFKNIQQVIDKLNADAVNYLILRNYECLLDDKIYVGGHEDIDILCENAASIVKSLGAISNREREDNTHYHIYISGNRVNLDLRSVGDGYYCEDWQREMLRSKRVHNGFYVMNDENYYYSLIYHAIFQKKTFTEEYRLRLMEMSKRLGTQIMDFDREHFIEQLCSYMKSKDYKFVYAEDPSIPLDFSTVESKLVDVDFRRKCRCICFHSKKYIIAQLVEIKRNIRTLCKINTPPQIDIDWLTTGVNVGKKQQANLRNICYVYG